MYEKLKLAIEEDVKKINKAIDAHVASLGTNAATVGLVEAQKYSLTAGGKRIRPLITLWFSRLFGGSGDCAMSLAIALEMIHTASLIHDDLPCIDNDDLRRGMPTSHKVFGESGALLAADALFMDAFSVISEDERIPESARLWAVRVLSRATGTLGLVGGEYIDIEGEGRSLTLSELEIMDKMKTGALIVAAAELGAIAGGVFPNDERMADVRLYAENIGLAFQITDDILDVCGSADELGKNPGADAVKDKSTYVKHYTLDGARRLVIDLTDAAKLAVSKYDGSDMLKELADYLVNRKN